MCPSHRDLLGVLIAVTLMPHRLCGAIDSADVINFSRAAMPAPGTTIELDCETPTADLIKNYLYTRCGELATLQDTFIRVTVLIWLENSVYIHHDRYCEDAHLNSCKRTPVATAFLIEVSTGDTARGF